MATEELVLLAGSLLSGCDVRLLGQKNGLDVGQDSALRDGHSTEKLVQLFVVADGELKMAGNDSAFLVVPGSVSGQLKNFGGEILHDGS